MCFGVGGMGGWGVVMVCKYVIVRTTSLNKALFPVVSSCTCIYFICIIIL